MRVALISGAYPPQRCGAEDYTAHLAEALRQNGVEARIFADENWSIARTPHFMKRISKFRPQVVHVQYPTMGYGKSLVPQAVSALMPKVPVLATLHEFSTSHPLRKVANLPFALCSKALVFTTEHERQHFSSWHPWIKKKSLTVPIGSNMPFIPGSVERDPLEVVYFGLIRPEKGLEEFVELAKLAVATGRPYRFTIVGETAGRYGSYPENLKNSASGLPIEWRLGFSDREVSRYLARARFAYMPFPDGASERRGSLLAVLGNGAAVITTLGPQTPGGLREAARFTTSPLQTLGMLDELVANPSETDTLSLKGGEYAARSSWMSISRAHFRLYEQVLNGKFPQVR